MISKKINTRLCIIYSEIGGDWVHSGLYGHGRWLYYLLWIGKLYLYLLLWP